MQKDPEKGKYFVIESSSTAPQNASWNAENVKKRAVNHSEEKRKAKIVKLRTPKGVTRNKALLRSERSVVFENEMGSLVGGRRIFMARVYASCLDVPEQVRLPTSGAVPGEQPIRAFCISSSKHTAKSSVHWVHPSRKFQEPIGRVLAEVD
jgi:hypothetical protein